MKCLFFVQFILIMLVSACTTSAPPDLQPSETPTSNTDNNLTYEIVAEGDPASGGVEGGGFQFAFRGDNEEVVIPEGLPRDAQQAVEKIIEKQTPGLFAVIYGGRAGSSGYSIQVRSVKQTTADGQQQITITFTVQGPGPKQMAADVLTYPYLILLIPDTKASPETVVFSQE
jgi:hypothetical protein